MAVRLSTVDNPYNPFDEWENWIRYDLSHGWNCCAIVDRLTYTSESLTEEENEYEIEQAIDDLIKADFAGNFIKVKSRD